LIFFTTPPFPGLWISEIYIFVLFQTLTDCKKQKSYWLPYPFCSLQSGHSQVIPLQVIPHWFSYMQVWQMENPHRQFQQNMNTCPQQWHCFDFFFLRFSFLFSES